MMYHKRLKKVNSIICFLLSLSFLLLAFSGCASDSNEVILAYDWNKEQIVVNGNEYVLVTGDYCVQYKDDGMSYSMTNNGSWSWEYSYDKMNVIGKVRVIHHLIFSGEYDLHASNEEPPVYLFVRAPVSDACYMLKSHTLPSKYTSSFISIDFQGYAEDLYFANAVSMEDIISYENAILVKDKDCKAKHIAMARLYYSENDIIYLAVNIYRINEGIYVRLDDVYYPIVMPEILDSLNTKK